MNEIRLSLFALSQVLALLLPLACLAAGFIPFSEKTQVKLSLAAPLCGFTMAAIAYAASAVNGNAISITESPIAYLRLDFLSSFLLPFIFLINLIVVCFSDRYLAAEKMKVSFIRHCCFLSVAAAFLLCSDNIFLSLICWNLISFVLYLLILHNPRAKSEARVILWHHLLSDIFFAAAAFTIYGFYGEACLSNLKPAGSSAHLKLLDTQYFSVGINEIVCFLLIISFSIKSALFPFHKWLLCTLEAPTPLSGLLHAGVVNVSAIMAFRLAGFFSASTVNLPALWGVLALGSALVGTLSMSAQFDVKRKLVYSTVGQMGFMCLQCALGAYPAAIFHLVAHGFFKCYLFLQSGSAVSEGLVKKNWGGELPEGAAGLDGLRRALIAGLLILPSAIYLLSAGSTSACSIVLSLSAAMALLPFLPSLAKVSTASFLLQTSGFCLMLLFSGAFAASVDKKLMPYSCQNMSLYALVFIGLAAAAFGLHLIRRRILGKILYVHALNGFYVDEIFAALKIRFDGNLRKKSRVLQEVEANVV